MRTGAAAATGRIRRRLRATPWAEGRSRSSQLRRLLADPARDAAHGVAQRGMVVQRCCGQLDGHVVDSRVGRVARLAQLRTERVSERRAERSRLAFADGV